MTLDLTSLDPCVHCGFCLPACPTYAVTGDEADSPRGRIVLMRALEREEIPANDPAARQHLDTCLGCRGCEPVCPSGVGYGRGLEATRELLAQQNGLSPLARLMLETFGNSFWGKPFFSLLKTLRNLGLASSMSGSGRLGFGLGMIAATKPVHRAGTTPRKTKGQARGMVRLFTGCIMNGLFSHVHEATRRTLEANGYQVVETRGQVCCGALHAHAGDHKGAVRLAQANLAAFGSGTDPVVVNSAGCGALLKDYGHLLGTTEAEAFGRRVQDVSELLFAAGPAPGGELSVEVAYDAPCHLQHAQRVQAAPLAVLNAIPGLRLRVLPGSDRCCGSAGIFSALQPAMSRAVLGTKIASFAEATPQLDFVATGNPGCHMQIGAGLRAAGLPIQVAHPVELLDWSYELGGVYEVRSKE
ncbi:MAG TPA: (Fe-S)-binding protein [Gemmatimonadales bacterium]|nr:(Fe-S)-binding protein [Gemmatimonadales bacterium]